MLRESIGNAVFMSVYEYVRHQMHSNIKVSSSNYSNLVDIGIGIAAGGLGGVGVSMLITKHIFFYCSWKLLCYCILTILKLLLLLFVIFVDCYTSFG